MTKVLLTGAGGYIGSVLTRALLEKGHSVIAVDRYFFGEEVLQSALASAASPSSRMIFAILRLPLSKVSTR